MICNIYHVLMHFLSKKHCCCPKEALCAKVLRAFAKLLPPWMTFTPKLILGKYQHSHQKQEQAPIITQIENQTKTGFRKILPITLERKNKYTHYYPSFLSHHWWHFLFSDFILDFKRYKGSSWLTSHSILFQIPNFEGALSAEPFGVQIKLKLS